MEVNGNKLQIMNRLEIKKSIINPSYYERLKAFYAQMISLQSEMLVIGAVENSKETLGLQK